MSVPVEVEESLAVKFAALFPHLDERQRRLLMGAEARVLGHGGVAAVARAAGASRMTVTGGVRELDAEDEPLGWTTKSLRHLADELTQAGHPVSAPTVAGLLREENFSLQGNF